MCFPVKRRSNQVQVRGHSNRAVFLDRDGTLAPDVNYCRRPADFNLFTDVPQAVKTLNATGLKVIVITNQSGIARGYFTEETLAKIHNKMFNEIKQTGAHIDAIYYCPHHPDDKCKCRKPGIALFQRAAHDLDVDLTQSFVIGDRDIDIKAGEAIGSKTLLVTTGPQKGSTSASTPDYAAINLLDAAQWIKKVVHEKY
jgi:histidinol-phosphate phosphatase family protein